MSDIPRCCRDSPKKRRRRPNDDGCYECGPCGYGGGMCGYKEYYYKNGKGVRDLKRCGRNRWLNCGVSAFGLVRCRCVPG
jgi:hypothetical protein